VTICTANGNSDLPVSGKRSGFPASARLLRHADFERVYKQGRRHFAAHMTVFFLRRPPSEGQQCQGLRVGFTVGRVLGGAVQRNRMKRRLREAVRQHRRQVTVAADVVINPKKSVLTAEFGMLSQEVERAFAVIQQKLSEVGRSDRAGPSTGGS
jgi:ribonuclease P protein component